MIRKNTQQVYSPINMGLAFWVESRQDPDMDQTWTSEA
jgi:hypothetical protein